MEFVSHLQGFGDDGFQVQRAERLIEQEKVVIEMNEVLSPVLVRPLGDEGYRCVVMPMRL